MNIWLWVDTLILGILMAELISCIVKILAFFLARIAPSAPLRKASMIIKVDIVYPGNDIALHGIFYNHTTREFNFRPERLEAISANASFARIVPVGKGKLAGIKAVFSQKNSIEKKSITTSDLLMIHDVSEDSAVIGNSGKNFKYITT